MNEDIIILGIGLVVGVAIIKFLTKFLFRLVGVAILIIASVFYIYFYTNFFEDHQDNVIVQAVEDKIDFVSVIEYQQEHCKGNGPMSKTDSITCECIIEPLVDDLKTKFTGTEIEELEKDKQRYMKEIITSLKKNQDEILEKLKEREATYIWNRMVRNLKKGKFIGQY